ncbi:MAG TPA: winged helix-turn-helix domain-containing protein [Solirubrobacterales bacterium]|nr:winged helix-turn-helix domain-containing protein [Solirubrobacterales bacterium]
MKRATAPSGNGGRGKGRPRAPLDRVLRALNHPVRRRIMRALVDGEASASALSRQLGIDLGVISYHLNQVLARECDVVELTRTVPRRGALEKFYRLRFQALTEGDSIQTAARPDGSRAMSLEECFIVAVAAMEADAFETFEGSAWDWFLAAVDPAGWGEICQARDEFNERARTAVKDSRAREEKIGKRDVVVGIAAFPAVSPPAS